MTTLHSEDAPYPFVPHHVFGVVLRKGQDQLIMWTDYSVEPVPGGADDGAVVRLYDDLAEVAGEPGKNMNDAVASLRKRGYEDVASVSFNFMSGTHYQSARVLADQAREAGLVRGRILSRHDGRHPVPGSADWPEWIEATSRMNACAHAARLLASASVEALANEILYVRFPSDFKALEKRRAGLPRKLKCLALHTEFDVELPEVKSFLEEHHGRNGIVHHKPGYAYDTKANDDVSPSRSRDPSAIEDLLDLVDEVFAAIFRAFGCETPSTHRREFGRD